MKIDPMTEGVEPLPENRYFLTVVDEASRFPWTYPLPQKQAEGEAQPSSSELCFTLDIPTLIRSDGGGEFEARCIQHLRRWLRADIQCGPVDHPRGQGSVE